MKIKHLLLPVCIASYLISASSCSHTDETEPALPDGTLREISFSLGGEFIDVSEEPLSRAEIMPGTSSSTIIIKAIIPIWHTVFSTIFRK